MLLFKRCVLAVQAISDIRGLEKVTGVRSAPSHYACFWCWHRGHKPSAVKADGKRVALKTIYPGHYTMLPEDDPMRAPLALLNRNPKLPSAGAQDPASQMVPSIRDNEQLKRGKLKRGNTGFQLPSHT